MVGGREKKELGDNPSEFSPCLCRPGGRVIRSLVVVSVKTGGCEATAKLFVLPNGERRRGGFPSSCPYLPVFSCLFVFLF